jgi:hypothetical protein
MTYVGKVGELVLPRTSCFNFIIIHHIDKYFGRTLHYTYGIYELYTFMSCTILLYNQLLLRK